MSKWALVIENATKIAIKILKHFEEKREIKRKKERFRSIISFAVFIGLVGFLIFYFFF